MKKSALRVLMLLFLLAGVQVAFAQELNCRIQINSDKIQGTNKQIFKTLQNSLTEFMNSRKWTSAKFSPVEKIECSFVITINEESGSNRFKGELQVQARRPVYNSIYSTTLINFRDVSFDFNYVEFEQLQLAENRFEGNLTATMAFYAYLILGLDSDSFAPLGGTPFFAQAEQIMNLAQSNMESGWKAFESPKNRHGIISSFRDETLKDFRLMYYTYHRLGLDEMSVNPDKSRAKIAETLALLKTVYDVKPNTVLLPIFSDAKIDEVNDIFSKGSATEKESVYKIMSGVFPAQSSRYESLRR